MEIAACFWSKLHQIIGCIRNLDTSSYLCILCQLHTNFSSIDYLFTQSLFHYLVVIYVAGAYFKRQPLVQVFMYLEEINLGIIF